MHSIASDSAAAWPAFNAALLPDYPRGSGPNWLGPAVKRVYSSSETPVSRKCATTTGAVDSEGLIVVKESIAMKRRGAPWRLPKFEYIFSLASASFSATTSRVYGCSFFRDLNDPVALKAFMTLATSGHDLTSTARKLLVVGR